MFNRNHGIWRPQKGDKFDKVAMRKAVEFFENDLHLSEKYLKYVTRFSNLKLTPSKKGFSDMVSVARNDVRVSKINLKTAKDILAKL